MPWDTEDLTLECEHLTRDLDRLREQHEALRREHDTLRATLARVVTILAEHLDDGQSPPATPVALRELAWQLEKPQ